MSASQSTSGKAPTILETIYAQRAKDVEAAKSTAGTTPDDLQALLASNVAPTLIPLVERLKRNPSTSTSTTSPSPSLMAEIKRASPSKGAIALTANPAQQALTYALSGASVISVLTEPTWFKGSLLDLRLARQAVDALPDRPAILRKEFILDEYQIMEARLHGADTVLLIVAMVSPRRLQELYTYSLALGMEPLVEVNNAEEMALALNLGARVIGVNNRNLHDFNVDMGTTSRLADMVKERDVILCALSGISSSKDIDTYKEQGVRAVLIGEALMKAKDTGAFIRELLTWPEPTPEKEGKPWIIASGVKSVEEANQQIQAGANIVSVNLDGTTSSVDLVASISKQVAAFSNPQSFTTTTESRPSTIGPWFTAQKRLLLAKASRPLLMGSFSNTPLDSIIQTTLTANLDLVQLDHTAPAGWSKHIPVPVVRRFKASDYDIVQPGEHSFILIDISQDGGKVEEVAKLVEKGEAVGWPLPIILSGVASSDALKETIQRIGPWAIEVKVDRNETIPIL